MKIALTLGALGTALLVAGSANAAVTKWAGTLETQFEVTPPVNVPPGAEAGAVFKFDSDTKTLCGRVEYSGLSGAATGIHVHKAPTNEPTKDSAPNDKVVIPVLPNQVVFKVILDAAWATALVKGEIYTNIHTAINAKGELRATMDPYDGDVDVDCPPGNPLPLGVPPDASAPSDSGSTIPSTPSTSGSSGQTSGGSTTPPKTEEPIKEETPPPPPDSGCSSTASTPANVLSIGLVAGFAFVIASRARRRKR